VKQAQAGTVVEPNNPEGFISAAEELWNDAARRQQLGRNARGYAEAHFDIERITDQFEKIVSPAAVGALTRR
jgi:glycosyltransferase involved in cell wall biosynthesis